MEKLRGKNLRFRWELPIGVSFIYEGQRKTVTSEEQINRFLTENAKELIDE